MRTIQLELEDELSDKLLPYCDKLADLLELGLKVWMEREQQEHAVARESLLLTLAASGKIQLPKPYSGDKPYIRCTPVPITGRPVSEILIEQREGL